jgi:hypothetical protein
MAEARGTPKGRTPPRTSKPLGHEPASGAAAAPPLCSVGFCPICLVVTAAGDLRPELMDHLLTAGRELLLAMRGLIDTRLESMEHPSHLERITIE